MKTKKRKRHIMWIVLVIITAVLIFAGAKTWVAAGRLPSGERLERVKRSPHYKDGHFRNTLETTTMTGDKGFVKSMWDFLFGKNKYATPKEALPTVKTDIRNIDRSEELVLWMGHSTVFIQHDGKRYLFDPVLELGFPSNLMMTAYKGTKIYTADDIPEIDYLLITHDHWDHLDHKTIKKLKDRVKNVVCALGIGENFEYWGYDKAIIHDMDWNDSLKVDDHTTIYALETRHFSGRLFGSAKAFWCSYMIAGQKHFFVTGDGGYSDRFYDIAKRFPVIDLAIMENGQYSEDWNQIHTMPEQLGKEIEILNPKKVMTYHNSKFTLANHAWYEPMELIYNKAKEKGYPLLTPKIGEKVCLDKEQNFVKWWKTEKE